MHLFDVVRRALEGFVRGARRSPAGQNLPSRRERFFRRRDDTPLSLDSAGARTKVREFTCGIQARSSVEEHYLDTVGVGSSILPVPTPPSGFSRSVGLYRLV